MLEFSVTGDRQIHAALARLPEALRGPIADEALTAGAEIFLSEARILAPRDKGDLARSLELMPIERSEHGASIAVATKSGWFVGKQFYGAFQEFGHHVGRRLRSGVGLIRRSVRHLKNHLRTWVPGRHFVKRAFDTKSAEALDVALKTARDAVEREASHGFH